MDKQELGVVETKFANLMWENEPISSGELVKLCNKKLGWKKSTTYTVLRKLCDKGLFQNRDSIISSLISKEEYLGIQCVNIVDDKFNGSLPAFVCAFTKQRKLSQKEENELRQIIES